MLRRVRRTPLGIVALTILVVAAFAPLAAAQDATPPAGGGTVMSPPRAEAKQRIRDAFPFEEPQEQGGQVIYGALGDIITLNGMLASDSGTFIITALIYETLYTSNPIDGQLIPALADSWELADDKVTYTFHLNPEARWHDGVDVTAEDVVFSFDAQLNPETGSAYTSTVAAAVASYRAIDDDTFEVVATDALVTFLFDIYVPIMPRHIWEGVAPADWITDAGSTGSDPSRVVGTGPFTFKEWVQGDHVTISRNDDYYDDVPVIDELVYRILPDDGALVEALKAGEIDVLETIPANRVEELQQEEGIAVAIYDTRNFTGLFFNLDPNITPLFQDRQVRQALLYALDREAISQNVFYGLGTVAIGMQGPTSIAFAPDRIEPKYDFDPEMARQLLTQAGWTDTNDDGTVDKDGVELSFSMLEVDPLDAVGEQLFSYMQEAWADVGVGMELEFVSEEEWFTRATVSKDFEVLYWGFNWDVTGSQGPLFRCDAYEAGFNIMKYCNPEFDRLDDLQQREFDQEARLELLIQQANIINQDVPVAPIRFYKDRTAYPTRLHNLFPNEFGAIWSIQYAWIEQ